MTPVSYVTDLSHFYDETGKIVPGNAGALGRYFGLLAEAGSRMAVGIERPLPMPCSLPTRRGACAGNVHVRCADAATITWVCPFCGTEGRLSGWRGAEFDLGHVALAEGDIALVPLDLTELDAARRYVDLDATLRARLADATSDGFADAALTATLDEICALEAFARTAADAQRGDKRRWLDRFSAKCEVVHRRADTSPDR